MDLCGCNCCFSIEYEIQGLPLSEYEIYFKGKLIKQSSDYYKVVAPTFEVYNGQTINRSNKYGFREGIWMSFYDNGKLKEISEYADRVWYWEDEPSWKKQFYESGSLSFFSRTDTTESWFGDGELKSQFIEYKVADTTFKYSMQKHDNRKIKRLELEKSYKPAVARHPNSIFKEIPTEFGIVYSKEYFENGRQKYLFRKRHQLYLV